jgi:HK97 family phage major capsid protein
MVANRTLRATLRRLRDTSGQKLLDVTNNTVEGVQVAYAMAGLWPSGAGAAQLILGDFTQAILGVRQDVEIQVFTEGVITDAGGLVLYNLMQQDMIALRATARFAFATPNPINRAQSTAADRYPFAVLRTTP